MGVVGKNSGNIILIGLMRKVGNIQPNVYFQETRAESQGQNLNQAKSKKSKYRANCGMKYTSKNEKQRERDFVRSHDMANFHIFNN